MESNIKGQVVRLVVKYSTRNNLLEASTGFANGIENITNVNKVQARSTELANSPNFPSQNGPCLMLSRPLMSRAATGIEYEIYNRTIQPVTILFQGFLA